MGEPLKRSVGFFVIVMILERLAKMGTIVALIAGLAFVSYHALEWVLDRAIMNGMCGNTVLAEFPSPGGEWKAVVFGRSCGATTSVSTQVSVLRANDYLPNESGNVCAVGIFPKVELLWLNARSLIIKHHAAAKIFRVTPAFEGITIKYEVQTQAESNKALQLTAIVRQLRYFGR